MYNATVIGENGNVVNMIHHDASTTMKVGDWSHETMLAIMKFNEDGEACVYQYSAERDAFYKTSFYYSYTLDLQELKGE